ncbi:LacI family transcriptional regulator [Opitutaceae bacterium TAV4]|nr:LacI family transcriptional regulator [Opitutaceae bacterium TAV4]RRK01726.1 LacI family transcriptional regulator [Opitutaceae bacterium TAV3]
MKTSSGTPSRASSRTTMAAVAERAGVSQMTVSLSLRDDPRISPGTRQRIKRLAAQLGYRPDPAVSQLMSRLRHSRVSGPVPVAWLTTYPTPSDWRGNAANRAFFEGATRRAEELGFRLDEFWLHEPEMNTHRLSDILLARGIHGVLVAPLFEPGIISGLQWDQLAAVACGSYSLTEPNLHRACTHHAHAVKVAWEGLTRLGYRRIGLVIADHHNRRTGGQWLAGLLLQQHTLPPGSPDRIEPFIAQENEYNAAAMMRWYRKQRPDVVLSFGQAREWLMENGVSVPEQCGFARLDRVEPGMACVDEHRPTVGAAAFDLVVEQLNNHQFGLPVQPKTVLIECSWHDGPTAPGPRQTRKTSRR